MSISVFAKREVAETDWEPEYHSGTRIDRLPTQVPVEDLQQNKRFNSRSCRGEATRMTADRYAEPLENP
jgi:hypothetical protein